MALLTRDAILNVVDLPTERVDVPEWGGTVLVRGLDGTARDHLELSLRDGLTNIRARLVALTVVDERGERLFNDNDVTVLGRKSAAALNRVVEVAQRLSAITDGDVKELEKNSVSGQSEDSGSV